MSTETLRYGVIGTGMMGCEHLRYLKELPGAEITAISDPHEQSRGFGKLTIGADVEVYEDHRELLARAPVDVVVIASPNHTHFDVLQDVFQTDKHVLVEKPLCTTVEDALAIVEGAQKHAGVFWVGMEYRYMRPVARLVEEVHGGAVGDLHMIAIREHRFPFLPKVCDWNRFNRNTGGTLVEKCCHFFDLMNLVTGQRPVRVYASGAQSVNHKNERYDGEAPDILDNAYVTVDFDGGTRGLLDLCMFAENSRNEMELAATGHRGKIEAFVPENRLVMTRRFRNEPTTIDFPTDRRLDALGGHHGSTFFQHLAFRDAIRAGTAPAVTAENGALAVAVGAAGELSARERRVVALSEFGL